MKAWALTLLFAAVAGGLAGHFLPKGENSPLFRPIRFLSAVILLSILCQPLLTLVKGSMDWTAFDFAAADENASYDPGGLLLRKSEESIENKVRTAFPEGDYTLRFVTDEAGRAITDIRVETRDAALGEKISAWMIDNGLASF